MPLLFPPAYRTTCRDLRLGSGLVLFAYVTAHLANHALGLVSVNVAEVGLRVAVAFWHSLLGTVLLYGAVATHLVLAMIAVYERRTLRMPAPEALRIALGFGIPLLLIGHLTSTRFAFELYGLRSDYARIVWALWTSDSEWRQLALLAPAWLHGCMGLNFAFGRRPLYMRIRPLLFGAALLLPVLSALGFLAMGRELAVLGTNHAWLEAHASLMSTDQRSSLQHIRDGLLTAYLFAVGLVLAARELRSLLERNGKALITISYPQRVVQAPRGWTVLEVSRHFGIPHRAMCGGRARCSTCRVRVIDGASHCPRPEPDERRTLERVRASPDVRLACQLRPERDIAVVPLFSAQNANSSQRTSHDVRHYDAENITISYDAKRCIHAEECVRGLPRVFDPGRRVWVDVTQANAGEIANIVQRCPTGALHFRRKDGGADELTPGRNEVRITPDGPLYLLGELEVHTATAMFKETRAALCRCGASRNKPFCDNSHADIGFRASDKSGIAATAGEIEAGPLRVVPATNGPCVVEGSLTLVSNGGLTRTECGPKVAFCRCGHSRNKPFCDGSHVTAGFRDIGVTGSPRPQGVVPKSSSTEHHRRAARDWTNAIGQQRKKNLTAFVLAGGGSLGAVQVGMLAALTRRGVVPDLVVGTSVGAINAAYYAAEPDGRGVERLKRIWLELHRTDVFPFSPLACMLGFFGRADHLVAPAPLRYLIESELPYQRLEEARLPCYVLATDALEGGEVVLSSGPAATALLASAAIPAVFPPVLIDGRFLLDGGVSNNTPISVAVEMGATRVIVLPTGISCALQAPPRGAMALALHALNLLIMRQLVSDIERCAGVADVVIVPPLCPLSTTSYDFSQSAALIHRAEAATRLWLRTDGLHHRGAPSGLLPHRHKG
jgi:NTE family protein